MTKGQPRRSYSEGIKKMTADKKKLTDAGWVHVCSIMSGDKDDREFGLMFTRNGEKFYLNIFTEDNLPV